MILIVCVAIFTGVAAVTDARTYRLPNKLTVPAFFAGLFFNLVRGYLEGSALGNWRDGGLIYALAGFATGFAIFWVLWMIGGGGGGDVKFMGALGAWLGTVLIFKVFVVGVIFMAIGSLVITAFNSLRIGAKSEPEQEVASEEGAGKGKRPVKRRVTGWGVPVAFATWLVLFVDLVNLRLPLTP